MNSIFFLIVLVTITISVSAIPSADALVFGYTNGTSHYVETGLSVAASCAASSAKVSGGGWITSTPDSTMNSRCHVSAMEWDISSIDDDAVPSKIEIKYSTTSQTGTKDCLWKDYVGDPSTDVHGVMWTQAQAGTLYYTDTNCATGSGTFEIELNAAALTQFMVDLTDDDIFEVGISLDDMTREPTAHHAFDLVTPFVQLRVTYVIIPAPDAVDDLASTDFTDSTVDLFWTEPNLNTGNLTGYQINYTTPFGDPTTIITNNTESSDVTTQISGLTQATNYTVRVGVWTESKNMTGNLYNFTTLEDFTQANFTVGSFDVNATNPDIIQMFFERQDINSTALFLNVTYPNSYNLACDFSYQFANINQTYTNLSNVTISADAIESSFLFADVDNEVIDVYCWDQNNLNNDGTYIITQTSFPLLQQIQNFRSGEYGTEGMFGAIDLITMAVIIISMIGFNRVNESVGAIFNIILLGSLAYFEIIELPTIIFGAVAVILMLVIASTRKK